MKTLLFCLMVSVAVSQTVETGYPPRYRDVAFGDEIHGNWLTVHRADEDAKDFSPSFTYIIVACVPIVKKLGPDRYEITFTQELAKSLP